ncbi:hypothetical protein Hanom_Chr16g01441341 [Helianthus anomalus]
MDHSKWLATVLAYGSRVAPAPRTPSEYTPTRSNPVKDIGANIGVLSGLLYSAVTSSSRFRYGLWLVYLVGVVQLFAGYFLMWLFVTGVIGRPHVWLMCLFMFIAAHAHTFFKTANVIVIYIFYFLYILFIFYIYFLFFNF